MSLLASIRDSIQFGSPPYLVLVPLAGAWFAMGVIVLSLIRRRRPDRTHGTSYPILGRIKLWLAVALVLAAAAFAAAQPRFVAGRSGFKRASVDVLLAIDVSASMWVKDLGPSRLEVAIREILNLQSEDILQTGDRAGLFAFGGTTIRKAHLSPNVPRLMEVSSRLMPPPTLTGDSFPWESDIAAALEHIYQSLDIQDRFEAGQGESGWVPAHRSDRLVLLLSDGDFTADQEQKRRLDTALTEFRRRGIPVYAVGIGSRTGHDLVDVLRDYERDRDYDGTLVAELEGQRTRLNMPVLTTIAQQTGGRTFMIDSLGSSAAAFVREAVESRRGVSLQLIPNQRMQEAWQHFIVAGILLFALAVVFY